jgi:uncharacterized protein (TIGR02246 family)
VEDRVAIQELVARCNRALDGQDAEAWADCFTDDGSWEDGDRRVEGRAALRAFARDFSLRGTCHWVNNLIVEVDGDDATLVCDHLLVQAREGGSEILLAGTHDDRLRRADGRWRFASRRLEVRR